MNIENPRIGSGVEESEKNHKITPREREAHNEILFPLSSRPEYTQGKEKLDFKYQFSTGEILNASEDDSGIANIVIKRGSEIILNFHDFLPNFKFLTPTGILKRHDRYSTKPDGNFGSEPFKINVGEMRDPKSILLLLHEIGHGRNLDTRGEYYKDQETREQQGKLAGQFKRSFKNERRKLAKDISDSERNAWAECIRLVRQIKEQQGVDVLEGFKNFDELQEFISAALINYREWIGEQMISSDEGFFRNIAAMVKRKLWGEENRGAEQWYFLKELFDKDRLKRKSVGELKSEWSDSDKK